MKRLVSAVTSAGWAGFALVGIDGMGGSGKSTLAAALAERVHAVVVHGDDLYETTFLRDNTGSRRRGVASPA